jgi:hypothetical protein
MEHVQAAVAYAGTKDGYKAAKAASRDKQIQAAKAASRDKFKQPRNSLRNAVAVHYKGP